MQLIFSRMDFLRLFNVFKSPAGEYRIGTQFFFNSQQLIVFSHPVGT